MEGREEAEEKRVESDFHTDTCSPGRKREEDKMRQDTRDSRCVGIRVWECVSFEAKE